VDLHEEDVFISFVDTLQSLNAGIVGVDESQLYRIRAEEIVVDAEGRGYPRYYLAELWKSFI